MVWSAALFSAFKLVQFESLGVHSYSHSILTMAAFLTIFEIFNMEVYLHLQKWVMSS